MSSKNGDESRTITCLFPDWPATALILDQQQQATVPAFVTKKYCVVAANYAARLAGITVGERQRDAESKCPEALVGANDPHRDARWFEAIARRCFSVTPHMEILRPGLITIAAPAVARFYGSEEKACEILLTELEDAGMECHVGVADTLAASIWAAARDIQVPPHATTHFVNQLPITALTEEVALPYPETRQYLVDTLTQMGCRTLQDIQRISRQDIVQRFGKGAREIYDMISGTTPRKVLPTAVPRNIAVQADCDPPLQKIDEAAFLARRLAVQLQEKITAQNLCCTAVEIGAVTTNGEKLTRIWRCEEPLSASAIADRMRWQIDGWLTARKNQQTINNGALSAVWITPAETHYAGEQQPDLWSGDTQRDIKLKKCVSRVQGLLGGEDVLYPVASGGWNSDSRIAWLPYGEKPTAEIIRLAQAPWHGQMLAPLPARHHHQKVELYDKRHKNITVSGRGNLSAPPHYMNIEKNSHQIVNWAGPWTINDMWWSKTPERYALLQIAIKDNKLFLLTCQNETWYLEGEY